MGVKRVPETYIFTCDGCKTEARREINHRPSNWAALTLGMAALDFQGQAVADGSYRRLLCRSCAADLHHALIQWTCRRRALAQIDQKEDGE